MADEKLTKNEADHLARETARRLLNTPPETRVEQKKRIPVKPRTSRETEHARRKRSAANLVRQH